VPSSRHLARLVGALLVLAAIFTVVPSAPAAAFPVPTDEATFEACGRVFPDPHAFWPAPSPLPLQSPFAKGNAACRAVDFLGWDETIGGLRLLEELLPDFVEVYDLSDPDGPLAHALDHGAGDGRSAGLPAVDLSREQAPMYLVRITDEGSDDIAIEDREHFVYGLSIHGIERAGIEGGIRAAEDLATWAACEADESALPTCALNGPFPHPILETLPEESVTAGEALRRSSVWFVLNNPDGWRRGDKQAGGFSFQRYNGNGMDLNRDWPNEGSLYRPYTPLSEPETRTVAKALEAIKDKWTGGIDLHGQLIDRAFSFTLIGGNQRPYDKDRRVLQFVKGAWADAEQRLAWSPVIKANDEPEACVPPGTSGEVNEPPDCDPTARMYGVQWGTIWDTIAYTTPGAFGDWVDSPLGLDADGIDNEMSVSHLSNCGIGTCYLTDFEQLHVDGNKSLIYSMIHYSLVPEDTGFRYAGRAGWLHHDHRVRHEGSPLSTGPDDGLPTQPGFSVELVQPVQATHEFDVLGPADGVRNGGLHATFTAPNVQGVSAFAAQALSIDRLVDGEWEVVNSYFNQAPTYLQAGARIDVNLPEPGRYRITTSGEGAGPVRVEVEFTDGPSWPDPGQRAFDVSNLDFFEDLRPFAGPDRLVPAPIDQVLSGDLDLADLDTLVIADGAFRPAEGDEPRLVAALRTFVEGGGNLVLTDDGLQVLERLGVVPAGSVKEEVVYAGHVEFSADDGATDTYGDPLAAHVDQPGAAEGPGHRHQMSEPIPTGWQILDDSGGDLESMPQWVVDRAAWEAAGGRVTGMALGGVTLGEVPMGAGTVRVLGSLLPVPTTDYDHPYGLSSYGVTYSGYEVTRNLLDWTNPTRPAAVDSEHEERAAQAAGAASRLPATGGTPSAWPLALGLTAATGLLAVRRTRR